MNMMVAVVEKSSDCFLSFDCELRGRNRIIIALLFDSEYIIALLFDSELITYVTGPFGKWASC